MLASTSRKRKEIPGVRALALAVNEHGTDVPMSAGAAARCLFGVMRLVAARYGMEAMQSACVDLVRCDATWRTKFGVLPRGVDGRVPEPIALIASLARGVLAQAGVDATRAAIAFWGSEDDPAVWQRVVPND